MTDTEPETNTEVMDQVIEEAVPETPGAHENEPTENQEVVERHVPLSAVQKERKRRQEAEASSQRAQIELQYYKEQMNKKTSEPEEEDEAQYESVTRAEAKQNAKQIKEDTMREIEERIWVKSNPEKKRMVDEDLAQFLQQRPNLAGAVAAASNRYEEAYTLMQALTPRQQSALKPQAKKQAPGSPTGVPKAAGVNQAVDVMQMSDEEYRAWRQTKRVRK